MHTDRLFVALGAAALMVCAGGAPPAMAQSSGGEGRDVEARIQLLVGAVVRVRAQALDDARSNATLGQGREGSGIVLDDEGHILTIGYLVIEPDSIEVTTAANRTVPATLAGYDHATGFGLLKAQGPLGVKPLPLGDSAALGVREPVMIVPFGGRENASMAYVVSTRRFSGSWEYLLDAAIFTAPPTMGWAGAALVNRELALVGVGSLFVQNAMQPTEYLPGNMFVPVNLLKPILADLKARGRAAGPTRPWLGLATEEIEGRLLVTRVSPESPADAAGLKRGDVVVGVGNDAVKTHAELYTKMWNLGPAGVVIPLKVLSGVDAREVRVRSIDRAEYFRAKKPL